jgi:hypothetical protein
MHGSCVHGSCVVVTGHVTTDSGGGFASVRCRPWGGWAQLGAARALRLVVRGDGKTYKVQLKVSVVRSGRGHQQCRCCQPCVDGDHGAVRLIVFVQTACCCCALS